MGDYQPKYQPGHNPNITLTGTVTGGNVITAAGVVAGANAIDFVGVASRDGVNGDRIQYERGGVQMLKLSGAVANGGGVKCAAAGAVAAWVAGTDAFERRVGKALVAGVDGDTIPVLWTD